MEVAPPITADAGSDQVIVCDPVRLGGNPTVSGGSGDFSYEWTPARGLDDSTSPNPMVDLDGNIASEYWVIVTDNQTGCVEYDSVSISMESPGTECGDTIAWGANVGECASDWPTPLTDQHGDTIFLYDYECDVILLVLGAMWSAECRSEATGLEPLYNDYRDEGFMVIEVFYQNTDYEQVDMSDLQAWSL